MQAAGVVMRFLNCLFALGSFFVVYVLKDAAIGNLSIHVF